MSTPTTDQYTTVLRRHLKYLPEGAPLAADADLRSLGLDSMAAVDLLFDLEDTFDVVLPDEALVEQTFTTPQSLQDTLQRLDQEGGRS
ncbi:phosphopantetheine-binding protein [Dactylosporangium sp. NBC_01737]|jgi:acyl carrier protein|uniref:phosphopantetheine-binding protein n=1 Tax=Dactylosporangium sp. NBC_01737 TaxID=2975959 RepID=UPI002E0E3183|nr:phosphopantetheine-binding protein [Dactylosporangium sp. NBC_01737]